MHQQNFSQSWNNWGQNLWQTYSHKSFFLMLPPATVDLYSYSAQSMYSYINGFSIRGFLTIINLYQFFRSGWILIFSDFLSMSFHDCFETGVHRLIRLRARTFFFRRSSFLLARINARPQIFDSSPGAPNHLPNSAQWQFFWLVLLTTVPQLSELKRRRKNVWRDVDLNPGPLPLPLDLRLFDTP